MGLENLPLYMLQLICNNVENSMCRGFQVSDPKEG